METLFCFDGHAVKRGILGKLVLSALQSGTGGGTQISGYVYVCADGRNPPPAEVGGAADLFLPAVLGLPSHGAATGRRVECCSVEHDPRARRLGPGAQSGGVGKSQRIGWLAARDRNRRHPATGERRRIL
jgi:hypothetical protein